MERARSSGEFLSGRENLNRNWGTGGRHRCNAEPVHEQNLRSSFTHKKAQGITGGIKGGGVREKNSLSKSAKKGKKDFGGKEKEGSTQL